MCTAAGLKCIWASRSDSLPDCRPLLQNIKIRHPIEQNMLGRSGLFRQQNIEKRRVYSLREWFEVRLILNMGA
jgi:hypothetical protein